MGIPIPNGAGSVIIMIIVFVILCLIVLGICIMSFYARRRYGRFMSRYFTELQRTEIERQNALVRPLIVREEMRDKLNGLKHLKRHERTQRLQKLHDSLKSYTNLSAPNSCVICYENLSLKIAHKEYMCVLSVCGHVFHFDCIWTWLNKDETCPMCRLKSPRDETSLIPLTLQELRKIYIGKDSSVSLAIAEEPSCSYTIADEEADKDSVQSAEGITNAGFVDVALQTDSVGTTETKLHQKLANDHPGHLVSVSTSTSDVKDYELKEYVVVMPRISCSESEDEYFAEEQTCKCVATSTEDTDESTSRSVPDKKISKNNEPLTSDNEQTRNCATYTNVTETATLRSGESIHSELMPCAYNQSKADTNSNFDSATDTVETKL